ncbi:MAG: hypothetical protein AAF598_18385 [Bacteroidota bacterium]
MKHITFLFLLALLVWNCSNTPSDQSTAETNSFLSEIPDTDWH